MEQALAKSENEQLLSTLKKDIQRLEYDLAKGLAMDHTNSKLHDVLDSLTHLRKVTYQLNAALANSNVREFDMNNGMYCELEKAKKIQKNLTKRLTSY